MRVTRHVPLAAHVQKFPKSVQLLDMGVELGGHFLVPTTHILDTGGAHVDALRTIFKLRRSDITFYCCSRGGYVQKLYGFCYSQVSAHPTMLC